MAIETYICFCGKNFQAKTADRKRGWARFCSKSCKAIEQENRTGQFRDIVSQNRDTQYLDELGWDAHKNVF